MSSNNPSSSAPSLSFRIQAPARVSSPLARPSDPRVARPRAWAAGDDNDSSDDEPQRTDELVTGFDARGLTRSVSHLLLPAPCNALPVLQAEPPSTRRKDAGPKKAGPLVIPSLPNKDWRQAAGGKRKKKDRYIPDSVGTFKVGGPPVKPGDEKTQGGMGTRDVINSTVVVGGLELGKKDKVDVMEIEEEVVVEEVVEEVVVAKVEDTEEQRALRELLAGERVEGGVKELEVILPAAGDNRGPPVDESDAFRRDVSTRPDEVRLRSRPLPELANNPSLAQSTLEDYARVPVGSFGIALLRGMGWKEGTAASRTGRAGPVEAFVPTARPSLLGIGAKPMAEVLGQEKGKNGKIVRRDKREDMKYVPVLKKEREGSASGSGRSVSLLCVGCLHSELTKAPLQTPAIGNGTPRRSPSPPSSRPRSALPSRRNSPSPPPRTSDPKDRRDDRRRDDRTGSKRARSRSRDRGEYREKERRRERSRSPDRERERRYRDERDRERDGGNSSRRRDDDRDRERRRD